MAAQDSTLGGLANLQAIATSLSAANLAQAGPLLAQVNFLPDAKQQARAVCRVLLRWDMQGLCSVAS